MVFSLHLCLLMHDREHEYLLQLALVYNMTRGILVVINAIKTERHPSTIRKPPSCHVKFP